MERNHRGGIAMSKSHRTSDDRLAFRRIVRVQRRLKGLGYAADDIFGALDDLEQLRMPHAEVLKLAGKEDGVSTIALMNALCRKVEAQKREINRLRIKLAQLGASENE
jgi:hypothetical protein